MDVLQASLWSKFGVSCNEAASVTGLNERGKRMIQRARRSSDGDHQGRSNDEIRNILAAIFNLRLLDVAWKGFNMAEPPAATV